MEIIYSQDNQSRETERSRLYFLRNILLEGVLAFGLLYGGYNSVKYALSLGSLASNSAQMRQNMRAQEELGDCGLLPIEKQKESMQQLYQDFNKQNYLLNSFGWASKRK